MPDKDEQEPADTDVGPGEILSPDRSDLTAQLAEMRERWMRSEAELANVRKRGLRDIDDVRNFGIQKFANDIVETAENLQRGLANLPTATPDEPSSLSGLRSGLIEIERGFLDVLRRNGVRFPPKRPVLLPTLSLRSGHLTAGCFGPQLCSSPLTQRKLRRQSRRPDGSVRPLQHSLKELGYEQSYRY
jgi:hypothetical protein